MILLAPLPPSLVTVVSFCLFFAMAKRSKALLRVQPLVLTTPTAISAPSVTPQPTRALKMSWMGKPAQAILNAKLAIAKTAFVAPPETVARVLSIALRVILPTQAAQRFLLARANTTWRCAPIQSVALSAMHRTTLPAR